MFFNKNYKPLLIAEIGLNHMGKKKYLYKYIDELEKKKIDGVTIQILRNKFYINKFKKFYFERGEIVKFLKYCKKRFKLVGVATDDIKLLKFLKQNGVNLIKILSKDAKKITLIKNCLNEKFKYVFISTSFVTLSNLKFIKRNLNFKYLNLIHTSITKENLNAKLKRIEQLRKELLVETSYGNHSKELEAISNSVFFYPKAIFFYVKMNNNNLKYPDKDHAIPLNKLDEIILKIERNIKML